MVLPRPIVNQLSNSCEMDKEKICPKRTNFNLNDYLMRLVNQHDLKQISSICFPSILYLNQNEYLSKLISDIKKVIKSKSFIQTNFYLQYSKRLHKLPILITKNDLNYAKRLIEKYDAIDCLFEKFKRNLTKMDTSFMRFFYLVVQDTIPTNGRSKCIHNTDNVKTVKVHGALFVEKNKLKLNPNGHFVSHFRKETFRIINFNINSSIQKLGIDTEYISYLLKHKTKVCE